MLTGACYWHSVGGFVFKIHSFIVIHSFMHGGNSRVFTPPTRGGNLIPPQGAASYFFRRGGKHEQNRKCGQKVWLSSGFCLFCEAKQAKTSPVRRSVPETTYRFGATERMLDGHGAAHVPYRRHKVHAPRTPVVARPHGHGATRTIFVHERQATKTTRFTNSFVHETSNYKSLVNFGEHSLGQARVW